MIGIIDYGMGNLRSVQKALERLDVQSEILSSPNELKDVDGVILPGVGAFRDAIGELQRHDFVNAIRETVASEKPLLGICLGQQLLFETSYEDGTYEGLGILEGDVVRFQPEPTIKIPHMGWNSLKIQQQTPLFSGLASGDYVYFVHGYFVQPKDSSVIAATTTHGSQEFVSAIASGNVYATQFHPEKSQRIGLQLLKNFANLVASRNFAGTTES
ncbi:imidazole glycerol phosphate synthase subunit HisH [Thalassoglobus polymorphus]|uniref:Imidazole glycerol phosphate synthase subunit HisH n=1 Tax=Thalassoglobus polymorphus TaxID=2527994 RepID=A0A517QPI8_9PLAN|nr:imidazole glycerol phosphate synthase subunit HisH [Thalassoglobus polymorphus]QDT33543.1 Imidazole glycerol phosphate synthase subunit HisH 1 [Thalassoglobus polymorphus]